MAKFSDQFERLNPLTFDAIGVLEVWPQQALWDARSLLKVFDAKQLTLIAEKVESVIEAQIEHMSHHGGAKVPLNHHRKSSPVTSLLEAAGVSVTLIRKIHGDINLFVAATTPHYPGGIEEPLPFKQWEGLAVLSLWKLADLREIIFPIRTTSSDGQRIVATPLERAKSYIHGTPLALEATRACALAAEGRMRLLQMDAIKSSAQRKLAEALYEAERLRKQEVSEKCRAAVMVRHDKTFKKHAKALELANSKPFSSRKKAAQYAADRISKDSDTCYDVDTVYRWLKAAGWEKPVNESTRK